MDPRDSMQFPNVGKVELSQVLSCRSGGRWNEVGHLGEPVHDDINGVMSL